MTELFEGAAVAEKPAKQAVKDEVRDLVPAQSQVPMQSQDDRLLEKVLEGGNIEVLERYIALRKSEQEREARIAFETEFVKMHAEFPAIQKNAQSHTGKYAKIEEIQRVINPIVKNHGFAYWWESEKVDGGILEYIVISYGGYSKRSPCFIPQVTGNNAQTPAQTIGSMQSYGRRYSIIDGFGLTITGEDDDGNLGAVEKEAEPFIEQIKKCTTRETLQVAYLKALAMNQKNKAVQGLLALAKDEKLRELKNVTA